MISLYRQTGLMKCGDTTIGTPGVRKGLSGGEMKRLGFGTAVRFP